jgi:hypothetical protein
VLSFCQSDLRAFRKPNADEQQCGSSARSLSRLQAGYTANIFQE